MNEVLVTIHQIGLVPVVVLEDAKDAAPLAEALCAGGLPCAEVTFRTEAAEESIRIMSREFPQMLIGAGTVLTTEQVDRAVDAGARFIVSPGLNPKVVEHCLKKGVAVTPGTSNPSDVETAIEMGLEAVKFFPAEPSGGLEMIKAMAAPYTKMKFMPTGGVSIENLNRYLSFSRILACGGSWMVRGELIREGKFHEIERLTREAVQKMLGLELSSPSLTELLLGKENAKNVNMLTITANHLERAVAYLELQGLIFDENAARYEKGHLQEIQAGKPVQGYLIRFVQR